MGRKFEVFWGLGGEKF